MVGSALVPYVTSAMNSVIKSLDIKQDDVIYFLNVTYGMSGGDNLFLVGVCHTGFQK